MLLYSLQTLEASRMEVLVNLRHSYYNTTKERNVDKMKKLLLGIALGASIVGSMAGIATNNYIALVERQNADIVALENEIAHLEFTNAQLMNENYQLSEQVKWTSLGQFKITYFWIGEDEYGDTIAKPCDGKHKAIQGHTIAVDPTVIPYGTKVIIDNHEYVAEDCGSAVKGKVIDIFVEEPLEEMYYTEVWIKE